VVDKSGKIAYINSGEIDGKELAAQLQKVL